MFPVFCISQFLVTGTKHPTPTTEYLEREVNFALWFQGVRPTCGRLAPRHKCMAGGHNRKKHLSCGSWTQTEGSNQGPRSPLGHTFSDPPVPTVPYPESTFNFKLLTWNSSTDWSTDDQSVPRILPPNTGDCGGIFEV